MTDHERSIWADLVAFAQAPERYRGDRAKVSASAIQAADDELNRLRAEVKQLTRERDAIQAEAVRLKLHIWCDYESERKRYHDEAIASVRKAAGLDEGREETR